MHEQNCAAKRLTKAWRSGVRLSVPHTLGDAAVMETPRAQFFNAVLNILPCTPYEWKASHNIILLTGHHFDMRQSSTYGMTSMSYYSCHTDTQTTRR
jgi:hypothetical protein